MRTKLILSAVALLMACKMFAVQLTPEEALARMNTTKSQSKGFATYKSSLQLTNTSTFNGNNTYYVFNKGNEEGYLILSADDCMPAVLGVVEGNSFDYDKLPDNMKWWLSQYDATISNYSAKGRKYVSSTPKNDIKPLLGDIKWDQYAPYNLLSPTTVEGEETPTGCVATAMAQVMGMYQWPKRGYGKNEYQMYVPSNDEEVLTYVTMARDFSKSRYEWGKILPYYNYNGDEPEEAKLAIAQLMYDCGVSVNMNYAPEGSGARLEDAANALVRNFSYDKDMRLEHRLLYDDDVWENMVYDNLSKGMPLLCVGYIGIAGHAYVCDGYQSDGNLFHFNWGWGGCSDGYFLLTGDDPKRNEEGLYTTYDAIFNLKPSATPYVEGSEGEFQLEITRPYYIMKYDYQTGDSVKTDRLSRYDDILFGDDPFCLQYPGYVSHEYAIGIQFKNETDEYIVASIQEKMSAFETFWDFYICDKIELGKILKNGRYTVSFVYKDITAGNTEWKDAKYPPGFSKPEVEIYGGDHFYKIIDTAELIYNGKKVTDGIIVKDPNVDYFTINFDVKSLKPITDQTLAMNIYSLDPDVTHDDYRPAIYYNTYSNIVTTVTMGYSIEPLKSFCKYGIRFVQLISGEYLPVFYPGSLEFTIIEAPTGIETIPQAEEKAASETIYDIYGRKVSTTNRGGLYIKNGKKFLVK